MISTRISARKLVDLLAGHVTPEEMGRWISPNAFADAVHLGDRLREVRLVPGEESDDDWIEFVFEDPDPATTPIKP